jgi:flagellar protein FliL
MKKKLMIALPVLLLVAAFAVKTFVLAPPPPDKGKLAKEPGPVYEMADPFTVNLADAGGATPHYAKVGVALRFSKLSAKEILPAKGETPAETEDDAELRDIVISTLQSRTSAQLAQASGRDAVKRMILKKVNKQTDLKITDVYYTEFAVS